MFDYSFQFCIHFVISTFFLCLLLASFSLEIGFAELLFSTEWNRKEFFFRLLELQLKLMLMIFDWKFVDLFIIKIYLHLNII